MTVLDSAVYRTGIIAGIAVGASLVVFGAVFTLLGLSGSIEWLIKAQGLESRLINASPGVLFAIAGVVVVIAYKPRVKTEVRVITEQKQPQSESGGNTCPAPVTTRQEFHGGSER